MATDMASYNKPNGNKKNIGVIIVTIVFAIIGILCIIIGYGSDFLNWLKTFGIVILVLFQIKIQSHTGTDTVTIRSDMATYPDCLCITDQLVNLHSSS